MSKISNIKLGSTSYDVNDKQALHVHMLTSELNTISANLGDKIKTLGYYNVGDGGSSIFYVNSAPTAETFSIKLANGLYANLLQGNSYNVVQFGAKGDGVTDDYVTLNSAIEHCNDGDTLYFPSGTFICDTRLNINKKIKIIGSGRNTTIIKKSAQTVNDGVFICFNSASSNGGYLSNLGFDGNKSKNQAIICYQCTNIIVENVSVNNKGGEAVAFSNCLSCTAKNVYADTISNLKPAFWCGFDSDTTYQHGKNKFEKCIGINVGLDGLIADDNETAIIECVFTNCGNEMPTNGALGSCGIFVDSNVNIKGILINKCICENCSESGINIESIKQAIITENICRYNGLEGIKVSGDNISITDNFCYNNGNSDTTKNPTLWLHSGIGILRGNRITLLGNKCIDDRVVQKQTYGVECISGTISNLCVIGNNLKYNKTDDANIGTNYPATNVTNLIYNGLNA